MFQFFLLRFQRTHYGPLLVPQSLHSLAKRTLASKTSHLAAFFLCTCLFVHHSHTKGHICFYVMATSGQKDPMVFTGDTLVSICPTLSKLTIHDRRINHTSRVKTLLPIVRS